MKSRAGPHASRQPRLPPTPSGGNSLDMMELWDLAEVHCQEPRGNVEEAGEDPERIGPGVKVEGQI